MYISGARISTKKKLKSTKMVFDNLEGCWGFLNNIFSFKSPKIISCLGFGAVRNSFCTNK